MQSQPVIGPSHQGPMRFASSELLKIETAWPKGQMGARAHALSSVLSFDGGGERDRTDDLLLAKQALSQLSYTPDLESLVGLVGFEPTTPALSRRCSNRLSYRPGQSRCFGSWPGRARRLETLAPPCATRCLRETNR